MSEGERLTISEKEGWRGAVRGGRLLMRLKLREAAWVDLYFERRGWESENCPECYAYIIE